MHRIFPPFVCGLGAIGLLILRVATGLAFVMHGWGKLQSPMGPFHWMDQMPDAPPGAIQALAVLAEFGGGRLNPWSPDAPRRIFDCRNHDRGSGQGSSSRRPSLCQHGRSVFGTGRGIPGADDYVSSGRAGNLVCRCATVWQEKSRRLANFDLRVGSKS
jgi:hypothetical protein